MDAFNHELELVEDACGLSDSERYMIELAYADYNQHFMPRFQKLLPLFKSEVIEWWDTRQLPTRLKLIGVSLASYRLPAYFDLIEARRINDRLYGKVTNKKST